MKIFNERPESMSLNDYHEGQRGFKKWLKGYKKGRFVYLTRRLSEQESGGKLMPVIIKYPSFVGKGEVKKLKYV